MKNYPHAKIHMLSTFIAVFTAAAVFALLPSLCNGRAHAASLRAETAVYKVTDFTNVADGDWEVDLNSDAENSTVRVNEYGELTVNAAAAANTQYYGALLPINPGAVYTNFTFELTFKVNKSNGNSERWLGIVYRTQYASETAPVTGYIMNYRLNGKNAYAAVNAKKDFRDINEIAAGTALADGTTAPPLLDGEYHRMTVIMEDNAVARHYIDGHLVREAKTEDQSSHLGNIYKDGGFALIVNCMELTVKSCVITPDAAIVPAVTEHDNTVVSTYQNPDVQLVNAPTVVCDVTDAATLNSLGGTEKPSNAILHFDSAQNVVGADGSVLGKFSDIYDFLDHKVIPVVCIDDANAADALIDYLTNKRKILDIAVMSDKPELVKKVREKCNKTRGIIEYSAADFFTDGQLDIFDNIVGRSNANYAMTVVVPQAAATQDNVRYIQARFKTVWVRPDSSKPADIFACINSGAYGIVGDFGKIYDALETYPRAYTRMPYNVAHRGKHSNTASGPYENSLASVQAAIDCGATHLELDGHMTLDGHIVIMHDDTLNRTTTGTGSIPYMTLEQIRRYTLKDGSPIPVLEDVFDILYKSKQQGKDIVFVFELKAGKTIVEKINSLLGTDEGQYDIRDNLVIITFNNDNDLLTSVKNIMPATPTSYLQGNNVGIGTFASDLMAMGYYNCGLDTCYSGNTTQLYDKAYLTDRGISSWFWTFGNNNDVLLAAQNGHLGLTNNAPDALSAHAYKIEGMPDQTAKSLKIGGSISVAKYLYSGACQKDGNAKITYCEETTSGWTVIASLGQNNMTLFTQPFTVNKSAAAEAEKHRVKIYYGNTVIYNNAITHGEPLSFTPPTIEGYKFDGYYADAEFVTPTELPEAVTQSVTLYAKYTPIGATPNRPNEEASGKSRLGAGAITGITLGCIGAVALIAGITVLCIIKRRKRK